MGYQNYINITSEEKENKIYRVMSVHKLVELFKTQQNTISRPHLWDDPFENYILKGRGKSRTGETFSFGMRDSVYGQCWTSIKESDAMWRIYSPDKNGVKIKTTIRKLFESLYNSDPPNNKDVSCFIGKVEYFSRRELDLIKINILDSTGAGIAKTLLIKRDAFSQEEEVRLIYIDQERKIQPNIFQYEVNPCELIEQIVFDPRMNEYLYDLYKDAFRRMHFTGHIIRSGLYKAPVKIFINID